MAVNPERAAFARRAADVDAAAHEFHELAADRQAQTRSAVASRH